MEEVIDALIVVAAADAGRPAGGDDGAVKGLDAASEAGSIVGASSSIVSVLQISVESNKIIVFIIITEGNNRC